MKHTLTPLTHRERFVRTLAGRETDRVPFIKVFGGDNAHRPEWETERPGIGTGIDRELRFEGPYRGWQIAPVNMDLSRRGEPETERKADGTEFHRWADGTVEMRRPGRDFARATVKWPVRNRADWERVKARHLDPQDPSRFPDDWAACAARLRRRDYPLQLTHRGVYGFTRNLMGDEGLAYAFYDDPGLVHDMMDHYTDMAIAVWHRMTAELDFDLVEFWEDMANKHGSMISPAMFREFMEPQYRKVAAFAEEKRIPILLVDSDGNIEELTGLMLEAGVTALYPFEVQAGNDVGNMLDVHPHLGAVGGLDKRVMAEGKAAIDREMERARLLIRKGRFIPGPDHFVISDVTYANYRYFMESLREVVMTTRPGG